MSKYKDELIKRLSKALDKDCTDVVEELYALRVIDDNLSRRGCVMHEYLLTAPDTSRSDVAIMSEIGEMFHYHERAVWKIVHRY